MKKLKKQDMRESSAFLKSEIFVLIGVSSFLKDIEVVSHVRVSKTSITSSTWGLPVLLSAHVVANLMFYISNYYLKTYS